MTCRDSVDADVSIGEIAHDKVDAANRVLEDHIADTGIKPGWHLERLGAIVRHVNEDDDAKAMAGVETEPMPVSKSTRSALQEACGELDCSCTGAGCSLAAVQGRGSGDRAASYDASLTFRGDTPRMRLNAAPKALSDA